MRTAAFRAVQAATVNLAATDASSNVALPANPQNFMELNVHNASAAATAFVRTGNSTVTASATADMPIGPGQARVITIDPSHTHIAAVYTTAGTGTVYFTRGEGKA